MNDADLLRVVRSLTHEATDAERRATAAWIAGDPTRAREVAQLEAAWARAGEEVSGPAVSDLDVERAWAALVRRKVLRGTPDVTDRPVATPRAAGGRARVAGTIVPVRRPRRVVAERVAAAALIAAGSAVAVRAVVRRGTAPAPGPVAAGLRDVTTARGQRAAFVLADGSRVALGAASRLRYDTAVFGRTAREVYLDGEASFEVRHDAARPFVVRTPGAVVRDLGTRFVLRDYSADAARGPAPEVVVAEGRVALAPPPGRSRAPARAGAGANSLVDSVVVRPGERARLLPGGALVRERGVDVDAAFAWTRGELVFRATPLGEAAARFGRWYDVTVLVPDAALARRPLTATFADEGAAEALRLAAAAAGARLERPPGGRVYVLRPR